MSIVGDAILLGGGGISEAYAVIAVTYPAGSACTCTKGTKTLTAAGTSGSYLFLIPEAGTWTVSCTDGTDTASKSVVIDRQYQSESIVLNFELVLFDNGDQKTSVTGGWSATGWVGNSPIRAGTITNDRIQVYGVSGKNTVLATNNRITIEKPYLVCSCNAISTNTGYPSMYLGIYSEKRYNDSAGNAVAKVTTGNSYTGQKTLILDLTQLVGNSYYVAVACGGDSAYKTDVFSLVITDEVPT